MARAGSRIAVSVAVVAALMGGGFLGSASAAPADPAEASLDVRGAATTLMGRVAQQPIQIRVKAETSYSLYLSPQGASQYKTSNFTRICKPPKRDKVQCWSRSGNGPWTKSQEPALNTSRLALVETVVNRVAGFVNYGSGVTYDKATSGKRSSMSLKGRFQGSELLLRLSFTAKSATMGLFSETFGSQPYESYSIKTTKAKKIIFPKR
jgi:hypothetical protein